ncbi:MAG TPA: asparaginase [Candidatus Limnocylindrales bacterium]|nr:asparaginase [Candidatus Limnocylindrales bacterium]
MTRVAVVFLGGTISSTTDSRAGGNVPTLSGAEILATVPGLDTLAELDPIDLGRTPASHFSLARLLEIAGVLRDALADPAVGGAVVVQGTDAIEETAFLWDLVLGDAKPVAVTGAMRAASDAGNDGPANLRDAVVAAASPTLGGSGVSVVMAGEVHPADDVAKTHATSLTTFRSPNAGPLATVDGGVVHLLRRRAGRRHVETMAAAEPVRLVTAVVGDDGALVDAATNGGAAGIVVAATGAGNTSPALLEAGVRAIAAGLPVVLATRTSAGRATTAYAFPGGGATWVRAGALLAGTLSGPKARIALALGLGAGLDRGALAELLDPSWG